MPSWVEPAIAVAVVAILLFLVVHGDVARVRTKDTREDAPEDSPPVTITTTPSSSPIEVGSSPELSKETEPSANHELALPRMEYEEDDDVDPTKVGPRTGVKPGGPVPVMKIVYDSEAEVEDPTQPGKLILVTATAQTDKGIRRKRNEDSLLVMEDEGIYAVADGMGGYSGGEIASQLAVQAIETAFHSPSIEGAPHENLPRRASELVRAVQLANEAVIARAEEQKELAGMGTTICAARFSLNKQRLYVAHVGDSRMYCARNGQLRQMTSDHTMEASFGVKGEGAGHLSRAVGVWPVVPVDVVLGKPVPGDVYLICSDGLTKMVEDAALEKIVTQDATPAQLVEQLIDMANASGGKDNITVVVIRVFPSSTHAAT